MDVRYMFIEWTKKRVFYLIGLVLMIVLSMFVWLNIGIGPTKEVIGTISSVGLDTSNPFELPSPIISVQLENGDNVSVEGVHSNSLKKGEKIVLVELNRLITPGKEYRIKEVKR